MTRDKKKRPSGRFISILMLLIVICSAELSFAADDKVTYLKQEPGYGVSSIEYELLDTAKVAYSWEFPYTDSFFRNPSEEFSLKFAQGSLGLALSAFRSTSGILDYQYEKYLEGAGFTDLYAFGYDKETTEDSLSGVIGMKQIDDFTVISAVTCGQGYGKEWSGNFKVGTGVRHEGFESAAKQLEDQLEQYIKDNKIEGKKKLWLTGMSRAAAIGNITAADMIESGNYEDVYAYLFGVPRTTKEPVAYKGIYNISGQYDPVASIPFESWGYGRYGTDLYTPAQESAPEYSMYYRRVNAVSAEMGEGFRNNPEVNYQLHLMMEAINELFKTSDDYAERLQPLIIEGMREHENEDEWYAMLQDSIAKITPKNENERRMIREYIDYMSYIAGQHIRADQRQVNEGNWNPDEALEANLVIEHRPSTYIKWLFSQDDPARLFSAGTESRRITINGDVAVEVYRDGQGLSGIRKNGETYIPDETGRAQGIQSIFLMKNGSQTIISLPAKADYGLKITADMEGPISIYDVLVSAGKLKSEPGVMYVGEVDPGVYDIEVKAGESPGTPLKIKQDGKEAKIYKTEFKYSPATVMGDELSATKGSYLSISAAVNYLVNILKAIFIFAAVCIIIGIYHRRQRKKGHPPYSDWYVIVPHLICIAAMAALTQYAAFFLSAIGSVRAQCAAGTVLIIALLALRGTIRTGVPQRALIAIGFLMLSQLAALYYNKLPIDSFSYFNMFAFFAMVTLFSVVAIWTFKREDIEKTEN